MTAAGQNPQDILCGEILADAHREAAAILERARREAEALLAGAAAAAEQERSERLAQAEAEAAHRAQLVLDTVSVEAERRRASRIETLLDSIREAARRQLAARGGPAAGETVAARAAEAVKRMAGNTFVVKLAPGERGLLGADLSAEIRRRVGREPLDVALVEDATLTAGGPVIEDHEGRQVWDNGLAARLERMWPELRRQAAVGAGLVPGAAPASGPAPGGNA